ncbi:SatD family protein [Cypionkella sp.]|uniref:SatD family protein n=1 Tax=Cypionkella sp. TaxID=2811411 RepID=UPI002617FA7E|nr:SatD family protein [Cypionkella sp.]MDB5663762.1 hypothetical protein [Cypionkella sp.]
MQGSKPQYFAVVMGDLVHSEKFLAPAQLHEHFNEAVDAQNRAHADVLKSPLTITLGDEFQGLAGSLAQALPIVRDLRLQLMSHAVECRFVIGIVELKTEVNHEKAWNMMGPGLARARLKLNEKKASTLYRFTVDETSVTETLLDALGAGLTAIERRWTSQQRDDIAALIGGVTPAELAKRRNVSVHSIYKVRASGDMEAYLMQWHAIAEALAAIDTQKGLA